MKGTLVLSAIAAAFVTSAATAQSLNIDLNATFGTPSAAHGGAMGQPGVWNNINNAAAGFNQPLVSLTGAATGASWTNITGNFLFSFNNAGTTGDHEALMDDGFDLGGTGAVDSFSISGLQNGEYDVIVYAWAPDSSTFIASVSASGSPSQNVGGPWPGDYQQGVTHATFLSVQVTNGSITIDTMTVTGFSTLNGVQIFLVPAPGALALLGLAGVVGSRRRRE